MVADFIRWGLLLASVTSSTSAAADELFAVTPSGQTEVLFGEPSKDVVQKIADSCMNRGWSVSDTAESGLTCEAKLSEQQSIWGQVLLGNVHSTAPRRFLKFSIAENAQISRVQGSGWVELQTAQGQIKRTDLTDNQFRNSMISFLTGAGGKVPPGTTYPNHADLGLEGNFKAVDRQVGFSVSSVASGGAAERAGVKWKDFILRIAGKRVFNQQSFLSATEKAAQKSRYEVELMRGGAKQKIIVERAFRLAATAEVEPYQLSATPPSYPLTQGVVSVADELSKLAKLKADGLLTAEEFEALKTKLIPR